MLRKIKIFNHRDTEPQRIINPDLSGSKFIELFNIFIRKPLCPRLLLASLSSEKVVTKRAGRSVPQW